MTEEWRDVVGWEGYYQISNLGNLQSVARTVIRSNGHPQSFRRRDLAPAPSLGGYMGFVLQRPGQFKRLYIHQMVLEAFVGPRPTGQQARHKDGKNQNNTLVNLEWGTKRDNEQDKLRHGTDPKTVAGYICKRGHALKPPNVQPRGNGSPHGACRACGNAHSYLRYHGIAKTPETLQEVADRYYDRIMDEV